MTDQFAEQIAGSERPERRTGATRDQLMARIAKEFREMAGLSLTQRQACPLFDIEPERCTRILKDLVARGELTLSAEGLFMPGRSSSET